MRLVYNCAMVLMSPAMKVWGRFNSKSRLWSEGRRDIFSKMSEAISLGDNIIWFHVASLGEFEQGRPLIELMRERHPEYKLLVTFFSPSGYEIRKNYAGADYIFYLPADTKANVRRFMNIVRPKAAFFIKYEFWLNYLAALREQRVPTYLVSSIFREGQIFFKPHGGMFREALEAFTHIFTQNSESLELLRSIGYERASAVGDTRFDRVYDIVKTARELPVVASFVAGEASGSASGSVAGATSAADAASGAELVSASGKPEVLVAGSTWPPDEKLLVELIAANPETKFIIAPHEIESERIEALRAQIAAKSLLYTDFSEDLSDDEKTALASAQVLFINTIGVLSSAYQYGHAAYIGGGFGVGIHNTLEAATFGLPLAFGPNYQRFREACQLIERGGARSVSDAAALEAWFEELVASAEAYENASTASRDYVAENIGATAAVLDHFEQTIRK